MATPLSIIISVKKRLGLSVPSFVVGSTEVDNIQLLELLNEECDEQSRRYPWTALQTEGTFTTLAAQLQGVVQTIAPGLNYIINDTIWNRSLKRPVFGPKTPQRWQQEQAFGLNGPWSSYRIKGTSLYMYPAPVAGNSCYFEYITKNWATNSGGDTGKSSFTVDSDLLLLDDNVTRLGLIWRYRAARGLEYAEDFAKYERALVDAMARDGAKDTLNLNDTLYDVYPGIVVPSGSWPL